ncbi:YicC family protein [Metabacillus sp. KIGAM252]|uniref:YicC family protein n=1 Tax=Metabacillus flavus TaxID=2823519 RepID=A0ABS5LDV1_9BACI|nr:YicC/YloC family endoribonuclease [Metabacillus flavus]MBS2968926.1 YicC family protein [Metabacillus flavus]
MIASMTGFGRAVHEKDGRKISVEMKSVNHRFCEISVKMPRQLMSAEDKIKKVISGRIRRGRLEAYITIDGEPIARRTVSVDWNLLDQLTEAASKMKERYGLNGQLSLDGLLKIEDVFDVREEYGDQSGLAEEILETVETAVIELSEMRLSEGKHLLKDIEIRLSDVRRAAEQIEAIAPGVQKTYTAKLSIKLQELLQTEAEESRILTEAAIFAEKADITEEVTRIYSHLQQFSQALNSDEAIGRKLDFIVQELNREANTIGSKANDSRIAAYAVELKSAIEKIKEQVQNVE